MAEQAERIFYRLVMTDPPTAIDFTSRQARGLPARGPEIARPELHAGLSHYTTEDHARATARRFPVIGNHIAAVRVTDGDPFRIEPTLGAGHVTIWGDPRDFLASVVEVVSG